MFLIFQNSLNFCVVVGAMRRLVYYDRFVSVVQRNWSLGFIRLDDMRCILRELELPFDSKTLLRVLNFPWPTCDKRCGVDVWLEMSCKRSRGLILREVPVVSVSICRAFEWIMVIVFRDAADALEDFCKYDGDEKFVFMNYILKCFVDAGAIALPNCSDGGKCNVLKSCNFEPIVWNYGWVLASDVREKYAVEKFVVKKSCVKGVRKHWFYGW